MSIKLSFNNEIHRVAKLPANLKALLETVQTIFKGSLPEHYALQYEDSDGDKITVCNDEDYRSMTEGDMNSSTRSIKVFVVPVDANSSVLLKQKKTEETGFQNQGSKPVDEKPCPKSENVSCPVNQSGCKCDPECCKQTVKKVLSEVLCDLFKGLTEEERAKLNANLVGIPAKLMAGCGSCDKICKEEKPCEKPCEVKEEKKIEEPKVEKKEEKTTNKYDFAFLKEISTIPSKITTKDMVIYKTISLKNTGTQEWPKATVLVATSEVKGEKVKLLNLGAGKEMSAILIINSPRQAGEYTSTWRLAATNEKGEHEYFGNPITVHFEVKSVEGDKEEPKKEEPKKEEPKQEVPKKNYSETVVQKAKKMKEMFPDADMDKLCEIISANPNIAFEELVENYLLLGGK